MKAVLISKEKNQVKFTMEFTTEEIGQGKVKAYQAMKDQFNIDGFRKGKAPRSIIEKHYGEGVFTEEAINTLFNEEYPKAVEELKLEVIDRPAVDFGNLEDDKAFTATITVPVYPEVIVKDYLGVETEKLESNVTDEDVDAEMVNVLKKNARMVETDGPAAEGATVLIDYKGFIGEEQFEGGTAEKFPLKLGSNSFIPGFEEQLIGISKGEEKDVVLTFPAEYHAEALAGKEATFKCIVHEIKNEEVPELNDEFAKDISEFDTLEEMKNDMKTKIGESKKLQAERQMQNAILEKIYNANEIDIPKVMIEEEKETMVQEFDQQLRSQGMDLETYLGYLKQEMKEFKAQITEDAERRVKTRMIVNAIADAENIQVTEDEVNKEIETMAGMYNLEVEKVLEMLGTQNMSFVQRDIKMRKAIELVYDKAVIK